MAFRAMHFQFHFVAHLAVQQRLRHRREIADDALVRVRIPRTENGERFRLARLHRLLQLPILANRFEVESAMLAAFFWAGETVEFVPVQTIYRSTKSRIHPVTDTWRWLRWRLSVPAG